VLENRARYACPKVHLIFVYNRSLAAASLARARKVRRSLHPNLANHQSPLSILISSLNNTIESVIDMTSQTINPQLQSALLRAPLEIRREIYGHLITPPHLSVRDGKLQRVPCVGSLEIWQDHNNGWERRPANDHDEGLATWGRRLASSWVPHWRCQELADGTREDDVKDVWNGQVALSLVCKRI
jgi:hypothetical protein